VKLRNCVIKFDPGHATYVHIPYLGTYVILYSLAGNKFILSRYEVSFGEFYILLFFTILRLRFLVLIM
jgi:hypothetical protein